MHNSGPACRLALAGAGHELLPLALARGVLHKYAQLLPRPFRWMAPPWCWPRAAAGLGKSCCTWCWPLLGQQGVGCQLALCSSLTNNTPKLSEMPFSGRLAGRPPGGARWSVLLLTSSTAGCSPGPAQAAGQLPGLHHEPPGLPVAAGCGRSLGVEFCTYMHNSAPYPLAALGSCCWRSVSLLSLHPARCSPGPARVLPR